MEEAGKGFHQETGSEDLVPAQTLDDKMQWVEMKGT